MYPRFYAFRGTNPIVKEFTKRKNNKLADAHLWHAVLRVRAACANAQTQEQSFVTRF